MSGKSDNLSRDNIANILNESFHDNEMCFDDEIGLQESDCVSASEIFEENSDDDSNYIPNE